MVGFRAVCNITRVRTALLAYVAAWDSANVQGMYSSHLVNAL